MFIYLSLSISKKSLAHQNAPKNGIEFDKINDPNAHSSVQRYCITKLSNILFTVELNKRLEGKQVYANSLYPGNNDNIYVFF